MVVTNGSNGLGGIAGEINRPFYLSPNRVSRTYRGGALLEEFRRYNLPMDGYYPEDWLGSSVLSRTPEYDTEGLTKLSINGNEVPLRDVIHHFPIEMLGRDHVQSYGPDPCLLVKLLDSAERLRIQVHPTLEKAEHFFGSKHGKTEAWIVVGTREIDGVKPYILLGFRKDIDEYKFKKAVLNEETKQLEDMLHRIEVKPGDAFLVRGGTPHAIGQGVFMIEIQEPTDLTINVEASSTNLVAEGDANHLGLGWNNALTLFEYTGLSWHDNLGRVKMIPCLLHSAPGGLEQDIFSGDEVERYFRAKQFTVTDSLRVNTDTFCVAVVLGGIGLLQSGGESCPIQRGDVLFIPAVLGSYEMISQSNSDPLIVVGCYPPSI
jgi:mannose-6-phosphate isomerase